MSLFQLVQGPGFSWEVPYTLTPVQPVVELAEQASTYRALNVVVMAFYSLQWERGAHEWCQEVSEHARRGDGVLVVVDLSGAARCWGNTAWSWQEVMEDSSRSGLTLPPALLAQVTRAQQLAAQLRELMVTCCRCYGVSLPAGEEGV